MSIRDNMMLKASQLGLNVEVWGDGNEHAEVMIVGEAPGQREVQSGKPFIGGTGTILWDELRRYHYNRLSVWSTNVVKRQLSFYMQQDREGKTDEKLAISKSDLAMWTHLLEYEIQQLPNVKYILALGNYALQALTTEFGVMKWRGSVLEMQFGDRRIQVVPTYNPAMIFREPKLRLMYAFDIRRFINVTHGKFTPHVIQAHIDPSPNEACAWIDKMRETPELPVSFDIETHSGATACIGLTNNNHEGMCINFRDAHRNRFSIQEEHMVRRKLEGLFSDTRIKFIAQNAAYDMSWLWYHDKLRVHATWFDTMLAHHLLYPKLPHSLAFLTVMYTNHSYYKDEGKTWREGNDIEQWWRYNVKDVCITRTAQQRLYKELQEQKLDDFFFSHVMRLQRHLVKMTVCGMRLDQSLRTELNEELSRKLAEQRKHFDELCLQATGKTFNPKSPVQLSSLFFKELKLVGRGTSTDAANRKRMFDNARTPPIAKEIITVLDQYAEDHKFYSTYTATEIDTDGRMRCTYRQTGTQSAPGRLSSASTGWGTGTNLQNQPEKAQVMFTADSDCCLCYFDLSQAEARIVAYSWGVAGLIENFEKAKGDAQYDVHRANAARIFKKPYGEIPTKDRDDQGKPTLRFLGKRCVHGLNYRMGADKLAQVCGISLSQAEEARNAYLAAFPEIPRAWARITKTIHSERQLTTSFGRRLIVLGRIEEDDLDSIIAFEPQSTVGDKVSAVITLCEEDPRWIDMRMMLNIHDALIAQTLHEKVHECLSIMKEYAEMPINLKGYSVIIPAEVKTSLPDEHGVHRWSNMKKYQL